MEFRSSNTRAYIQDMLVSFNLLLSVIANTFVIILLNRLDSREAMVNIQKSALKVDAVTVAPLKR